MKHIEASFANQIDPEEWELKQITIQPDPTYRREEKDIMENFKQKQQTELTRIEKAAQIAGF